MVAAVVAATLPTTWPLPLPVAPAHPHRCRGRRSLQLGRGLRLHQRRSPWAGSIRPGGGRRRGGSPAAHLLLHWRQPCRRCRNGPPAPRRPLPQMPPKGHGRGRRPPPTRRMPPPRAPRAPVHTALPRLPRVRLTPRPGVTPRTLCPPLATPRTPNRFSCRVTFAPSPLITRYTPTDPPTHVCPSPAPSPLPPFRPRSPRPHSPHCRSSESAACRRTILPIAFSHPC
jgi:hypothetical protein